MKGYTQPELLQLLRKRVEDSTQTEVARQLGVSIAHINDLVHGRRNISPRIARELGFEVMYRRIA